MRQRGFTYIGLLIAIALMAVLMGAAGALWSTVSKRDREAELLFAGTQIRQAIISYHDRAPAGQLLRFPQKLDDLLLDKRWPTTRRHLRRIFIDPMTGTTDWGLVAAPGGGIAGVFSRAPGMPLKRAGFEVDDAAFEDAASYSDWRFGYPTDSLGVAGPASSASAPKFSLPGFGSPASAARP